MDDGGYLKVIFDKPFKGIRKLVKEVGGHFLALEERALWKINDRSRTFAVIPSRRGGQE